MIQKVLLQKALLFTAFSLTCSLSANIAISVDNLNADGTYGTITAGGFDAGGSTTVTPSTTASGKTEVSSQTMAFTITGLDIDGVGSADDSVNFSIMTSAYGGTINSATPSLTLGDAYTFTVDSTVYWGNTGILPGSGTSSSHTSVTAGEILSFSFVSGSVELGAGGAGGYGVSFDGFGGVTYDRRTDPTYGVVLDKDGVSTSLDDESTETQLGDPSGLDLESATTFAIGLANDGSGRFRLTDLDFGVTIEAAAVPEAETVSLFAGVLGLMSIVFIRRRMKS